MSISAFLQRSAAALRALGPDPTVLFVTGNESADMDSCASSIVTGYLLDKSIQAGLLGPSIAPNVIVPLINIPRRDFGIRKDIAYVLDSLNISSQHLLFRDDLESLGQRTDGYYAFLVDFNKLTSDLSPIFNDRVVGIIDHHEDEGLYADSIRRYGAADFPRQIVKSGSCTSLVVNYWNSILGEKAGFGTDIQLRKLALAPIFIDTSFLTSKVERFDLKAIDTLRGGNRSSDISATAATESSFDFDAKAYYQKIRTLKTTLDGLSGSEILRKDYKQWNISGRGITSIGISSAPQSLQGIVDRHPDFVSDIKKSANERNVDVYVVMTSFLEQGKFSRELLFYGRTAHSQEFIRAFVSQQSGQDSDLNVSASTSLRLDGVTVLSQLNTAASRKQVAPLLVTFTTGAASRKL